MFRLEFYKGSKSIKIKGSPPTCTQLGTGWILAGPTQFGGVQRQECIPCWHQSSEGKHLVMIITATYRFWLFLYNIWSFFEAYNVSISHQPIYTPLTWVLSALCTPVLLHTHTCRSSTKTTKIDCLPSQILLWSSFLQTPWYSPRTARWGDSGYSHYLYKYYK